MVAARVTSQVTVSLSITSKAPQTRYVCVSTVPLCRHHHRCKQAKGWWLEQSEPGVLTWHTPAGRSYTTTPTQYAI